MVQTEPQQGALAIHAEDLPVGAGYRAIRSPRGGSNSRLPHQNSAGSKLLTPSGSTGSLDAENQEPAPGGSSLVGIALGKDDHAKRALTRVQERKRTELEKKQEQEKIRQKKLEEDKVKKEHDQQLKHRRRAEIYALNGILRQIQQEKMAAFIAAQKQHPHTLGALPVECSEATILQSIGSTDHVFAVNGLDRTFDETVRGYAVKTRRRGDGREQLFMELQDIKLVPFALDRAIQAVWTAVSGEFTGRSRVIESCHSLDDRFAVRYQTRSHALAKEGVLNVGMVMKRFRTPTHMVLVWRATNSCGDDHQEWQNHYTEETGWIVVKRVPATATTGLEPETSVMQSCVHLLPRWITSADTEQFLRQTKAGDFTKLVMNAYESVVVGITETIENLLVDESLGLVGGGPIATFSPGR